MTTDLVPTTPGLVPGDLDARLRFVAALADAGALPPAFRKRPADLLLVASYADDLGLGFASAISSLYVVDGKVTLSASLVASLVRRAGHRLRTTTTYDDAGRPTIVATIVRADDPEWSAVATWDLDRATRAGLAGRETWKRYPEQMLRARAVTEAAREACPEVLSGLYLADEVAAEPVTVERADVDPVAAPAPADAARQTPPSDAQMRATWARLHRHHPRDEVAARWAIALVLGRSTYVDSLPALGRVAVSRFLSASDDDVAAAVALASSDPVTYAHPDDRDDVIDVDEVVDAVLVDDADPDGIVADALADDVAAADEALGGVLSAPARAAVDATRPPRRPRLSTDPTPEGTP